MNIYLKIGLVLVTALTVGCATVSPPSGPSALAQQAAPVTKRNASRVPHCMEIAARESHRVQQANMGNQVAGGIVGGVLGAVAGAALSTPSRSYVGRTRLYGYTRYGYPVYGRRVVRVPGTNLAGLGAAAGAAGGAALMGNAQQDPQTAYDSAYMRCMQGGY